MLAARDGSLEGRIVDLRAQVAARCRSWEVAAVTRQPLRVRTEPLPATHDELVVRLRTLVRAGSTNAVLFKI